MKSISPMSPTDNLTKNQKYVFDVLKKEKTPLSAYTILDQLRLQGFRAPLQVYRALDKLVMLGLVHKLQSLNAYIACSHPNCDDHHLVAFAICKQCGNVNEFNHSVIENEIYKISQEINFAPQSTTLEIRGICAKCTPDI